MQASSRWRSARGLTLLEVVIALLLFSMMSMFLLRGHADAADAILKAEVERDMAELLRLRLDVIALDPEKFRDTDARGGFPADVSDLIDEEKILGDRFRGYTWEAEITEVIAAGADGRREVDGADEAIDVLFPEEGAGTEADDGIEEEGSAAQASEVDRMLLIKVTVFPPGYDSAFVAETEEERARAVRPRSAWTAVYLPPDEDEGQ